MISTHKLTVFVITLLYGTGQIALAMDQTQGDGLEQRASAILSGIFLQGIQKKDLSQVFKALLDGANIRPYRPDEIPGIFKIHNPNCIYKIFKDTVAEDDFDDIKQLFQTLENIEHLLNGVRLVKIPWVGYVPLTRKNVTFGVGVTVAILCAAGHKYVYDYYLTKNNDVVETNQEDIATPQDDTQNQKPDVAETTQ